MLNHVIPFSVTTANKWAIWLLNARNRLVVISAKGKIIERDCPHSWSRHTEQKDSNEQSKDSNEQHEDSNKTPHDDPMEGQHEPAEVVQNRDEPAATNNTLASNASPAEDNNNPGTMELSDADDFKSANGMESPEELSDADESPERKSPLPQRPKGQPAKMPDVAIPIRQPITNSGYLHSETHSEPRVRT